MCEKQDRGNCRIYTWARAVFTEWRCRNETKVAKFPQILSKRRKTPLRVISVGAGSPVNLYSIRGFVPLGNGYRRTKIGIVSSDSIASHEQLTTEVYKKVAQLFLL